MPRSPGRWSMGKPSLLCASPSRSKGSSSRRRPSRRLRNSKLSSRCPTRSTRSYGPVLFAHAAGPCTSRAISRAEVGQGNTEEAIELLRRAAHDAVLEALPILARLGDRLQVVWGLAMLARILAARGHEEAGGVCWGCPRGGGESRADRAVGGSSPRVRTGACTVRRRRVRAGPCSWTATLGRRSRSPLHSRSPRTELALAAID